MPAGTIALTNGSTTVTGTGTSFTTELKAGDFVNVMVGGAPYTMVASVVTSNTQLTLAVAFDGPTTSGLAWVAAPALMLSAITQKMLNDFANVARGRILDFQNWQKIYSNSQSVTVSRPDRTTFTGPSWGYMASQFSNKADLVSGAVAINQGGTGQKTASDAWKALLDGRTAAIARNDLGLGNAATRTVTEGRGYPNDVVLGRGAFGLGGATSPDGNSDGRYNEYSGFYAGPGASGTNYFDAYAPMLVMSRYQGVLGMMQISPVSGKAAVRGRNGDVFTNWLEIYTTGNTTKASDGTLKAASPVARIVKSQEATTRADVVEAGFSWCGCGTSNKEAEGISISRLDTGVYILAGSAGLASEGWQLLPPRDPQGSGDLGIVEAEQTESGGLTIRLYKRRYKLSDDGDILVVKGDLIDVPSNSWIDVRLNMPKDSVYNANQTEVK